MEGREANTEGHRDRNATGGNSASSRRYRLHLSASNFLRSPISALLEYSGLLRPRSSNNETEPLISGTSPGLVPAGAYDSTSSSLNEGEVSIRIIGGAEGENERAETSSLAQNCGGNESGGVVVSEEELRTEAGVGTGTGEGVSSQFSSSSGDAEAADASGGSNREGTYQRYDIQQAARWIEQVLPFSLLLLVVFIRQHLQGFFITIWVSVFMFKSNDILRKHTALKGERKISVLIGYCILFTLHVVGVYWWYRSDDLLHPLIMLPPKEIPPFWHALFIIMINDTLVRQAAMIVKCVLLVYYKNSRGRNYRRQGQMLTLVEYLLLLYRALLPAPVWYRFFLNKEYGSLFSSLMTGLYLTFKLTSVVEKVQTFFAAVRALSRTEVHYGAYATSEQVSAAGDMCAICQEKMHTPVLLRCKHLFCEDCVSEWFERERTCPLCRALVKPADLKSFGDGSTSLFFQLF
ncbi:uncharacterized protein LOC141600663 [Silene latifolia]|uniref:uncharacterized protein LOC141600663 n=1 Tax=Silene latifolia TaxID=37657 RepID=UPI003D789BFA